MTFLPVVERELRIATRKRATYWARVGAAVAGVLIMMWAIMTVGALVSPTILGKRLFMVLSSLGFFYCLWPGVILTSDCISSEKRDGTLGLLFLTDLHGYDVVFGKLLGTSLSAFYSLLALIPALGVPLLLGGVTGGELARMSLVLANTLFLSLSVGMLMSVLSLRAQRSMLATAALVMGMTYLLPLAGMLGRIFSPLTSFKFAFDLNYGAMPALYPGSLMGVQLFCWAMLCLACWWAPQSWQVKLPSPGRAVVEESRKGARQRVKSVIGERSAVEWLTSRQSQRGWIWGSLGVALLVWAIGPSTGMRKMLAFWIIVGALFLQFILQFWLAWEACRRLHEERVNGSLEVLLSTPLSVDEILFGHFKALKQQFMPLVAAVALFDVLTFLWVVLQSSISTAELPEFFVVIASIVTSLVVNSLALVWLGLWRGLWRRNIMRAALGTLLRVVILPLIVFLVVVTVMVNSGSGRVTLPTQIAAAWLIIGGANAYFFYCGSRDRLRAQFRRLAAVEDRRMGIRFEKLLEPYEVEQDYALVR
ncbi:MAG TPA: hypothetical protein VGE41_05105 [Verrucomicrobiae bacterium]